MDINEKVVLLGAKKKKGPMINKGHYDTLTNIILESINNHPDGEVGFYELLEDVKKNMPLAYQTDLPWYVLQVKVDLQEREIIKVSVDKFRRQTLQINRKTRKFLTHKYSNRLIY